MEDYGYSTDPKLYEDIECEEWYLGEGWDKILGDAPVQAKSNEELPY